MSSGLGLFPSFPLTFLLENQDRKRRQSVDALQEPIEEPVGIASKQFMDATELQQFKNGGWHRIEQKRFFWMQPNNSSSYLWEVFFKKLTHT